MRYFYAPLPVFAAGLGIAVASLSAVPCFADDAPFVVPSLTSFDGKTWGGLVLGMTTQDGLKKAFQNDRGDYSTSVALKTATDQPYKVSALFPGKDKNATLQGIVVRYRSEVDGLSLDKVTAQLGGDGAVYYPRVDRYERWSIIAYPERGILLFVVDGKVNIILIGYPARMPQVTALVSPTEIPVDPLEKHYEGRIPEIVYGTTDVSFSLSNPVHLRDKDRETRQIKEDMRDRPLEGLRYQSGGTGKFSISVSVTYKKDKGGTGTIEGTIEGEGKYGPLRSSVSHSFDIDSGMDTVDLENTKYYRTLRQTLRDTEDDAARKARTQGPPPVTTFRRLQWDKLVDTYRFHADPPANPAKPNTPDNGGGLLNP